MFANDFNVWLIVMIGATLVLLIGRSMYVEGSSSVMRRIHYRRPNQAEKKEMRLLTSWGRFLCAVGVAGVFVTLVQVPGLNLADPTPMFSLVGYPLMTVIFWSLLRYLDGGSQKRDLY